MRLFTGLGKFNGPLLEGVLCLRNLYAGCRISIESHSERDRDIDV